MSLYGQGRGGRPWRRTVDRIKLRDGYTCQMCQRITATGEVDHKVPLSKGGTDDDANLQYLCKTPCHATKSAKEANPNAKPKQACGVDGWPL